MYVIATKTDENQLIINSNNGILCNDDIESFSVALELCFVNKKNFEFEIITQKTYNYEWQHIVKEILAPFINNKIKCNE